MNGQELELAFQGSRFPAQRRIQSMWNGRATFGRTITVVECWLYGGLRVSEVEDIQESQIENWLNIAPPRSQSGQEPSAGLRIIHCGQWNSRKSPFTQEVTQAITRAFRLPDSVSEGLSGACVRLTSGDSPVFVCRRGKSAWTTTTVLRYDHRTNITVGYVYSAIPLEIRDDLERLPSQFANLPHPLLLPLLMHELALEHLTQNMDNLDENLQDIEAQTGFSDYEKIYKSGERDYRPQIERLGRVTHGFAYDQVRLRNVELTNEFLRQQMSSMDTWLPDAYRRAVLKVITTGLQERLYLSWSSIQHLQLYRGFEKRLQVRQNVLFNLIAQQDSAANMKIAAATRRDSAGMKVIAVLTALFLPGTLVAAFFAMPLFDWQASDGSQIVNRWFWIYWAVTVPLTVVIGVMITRYVIVQGRRARINSRATRDIEVG